MIARKISYPAGSPRRSRQVRQGWQRRRVLREVVEAGAGDQAIEQMK